MTAIPESVRRQALYPFHELPPPENLQLFPLDGAMMSISTNPGAQTAIPIELDFDVAAAVRGARGIAREHGHTAVVWWIGPDHDGLAPAFEALGVVNGESPGFEAIENAMALVEAPCGDRPEGIDVRPIASFEDYCDSFKVLTACFGFPPRSADELRDRYAEYVAEPNGRSYIAADGDRVVAHSYASFGAAGLNLFGGAVLPDARGKGVYRALTFARWDVAVERGTPALTVQAGKMSMPILERLGFQLVGRARVFVDAFGA